MKIKTPIFLNCLSRGGSNIFWNVFLSHPDACSPIRETLELFRIDLRDPHWEGFAAILLSSQFNLFNQWKLEDRRPINQITRKFIDTTFQRHKLRTLTDPEMRFKAEGIIYTPEEVENARLVTKNNNGISFLSDTFSEMYPDATFFALLRDPIPLYESHRRRKISNNPHQFVTFYNRLLARVIHDQKHLPNYHIVRFEDILADPTHVIPQLYEQANLDPGKVRKVRFRAKPHYLPDGTHSTNLPAYKHFWFSFNEIYEIIEPNINQFQTDLVHTAEREEIETLTQPYREAFGYA